MFFAAGPFHERLAQILVHFLWQGTLVAISVALLLSLGRIRRPGSRYVVNLVGLLVMAVWPVATFFTLAPTTSATTARAEVAAAPSTILPQPTTAGADTPAENPPVTPAPAVGHVPSDTMTDYLASARPWIVLAWSAGVVLLSGRLLLGVAGLWRLRRGRRAASEEVAAQLARLAGALRMRRPRVFVHDGIGEALAVGLFRPFILLPASWLLELPAPMLEAVLAHELAHVRRGDLWVNLLQRVVETMLFYHPAVWWLSRQLRLDRELCCDELAVAATAERLIYVQTLAHVAQLTLDRRASAAAAIGGVRGTLLQRVQHLLGVPHHNSSTRPWLAGAIALLIPLATWWLTTAVPSALSASESAEGTITGTVVHSTGEPARFIEVLVYQGGARTSTLQTDAAGGFKLPRPDNDEALTLLVRRPGLLGWWVASPNNPQQQGKEPRITLLPIDQKIEGTLVSPEGRPLGAVPIELESLSHKTNGMLWQSLVRAESLMRPTLTGAQGRFTLLLPADSHWEVRPMHRDWQAVRLHAQKDKTDLGQVTLHPAGAITGRVTDAASGAPLAGAHIGAQKVDGSDFVTGGYSSAVTDADGRYTILGLSPGQYNALFSGPRGDKHKVAVAREAVLVEARKTASADFQALEGQRLGGIVLDAERKPLADCHVGYYGPARPRSGAACMMVKTDTQGRFHFHVPPGASYLYVAEGKRVRGPESARTLGVTAGFDEAVVLVAGALRKDDDSKVVCLTPEQTKRMADDQSYRLNGTFKTSAGRPVNAVRIYTVSRGSTYASMTMISSGNKFTTQFGNTSYDRTYYLVVDAAGFAPTRSREFTVAKEIPPLTIELTPAVYVPVRGRVVNAAGRPVAGARVRTGKHITLKTTEFPWGVEQTTDSEGRFELKHVRVGERCYVYADKDGLGGIKGAAFDVDNATPLVLPDLRFPPANQQIKGRVLDTDGDPVPGARVVALVNPRREAMTDAQGHFVIKDLLPGLTALEVTAEGFRGDNRTVLAGGDAKKFWLARLPGPDADAYTVQLDLKPTDAKTVASAHIYFFKQDAKWVTWSTQLTNANTYQCVLDRAHRKPGTKLAFLVLADGYAAPTPASFDAKKNLEPVRLALEPAAPVQLRGRVVDGARQPLPGVKVGLSRTVFDKIRDEPWSYSNSSVQVPETGPDGRFVIGGVHPGSEVAVYVNRPGGAGAWSARVRAEKGKDLEVGDLRLEKATRTVTGRVLDHQNRPVRGARVFHSYLSKVETTTDAEGHFRLAGVPGGVVHLVVVADDHEPHYQPVTGDTAEVKLEAPDDQ